MSVQRDPWHFQRWAWGVTVGNVTGKACLAYLAKCADPSTGRCEAKQTTIAAAIEASPRAVRDHLASLEGLRFIVRRSQRRVDGGRRNDEFLLLAPGVDEWPDGERLPDPPADPAGGSDTPPGVSTVPGAPAGDGTPPGVSAVPGKKDHQGSTTQKSAADARESDEDRTEKVRMASAIYAEHVREHVESVPEWEPAMVRGAANGILSLIQGAPSAPWAMIAASAAAARAGGDLTTGSPIVALQFKLQDWTRGGLGSTGAAGGLSWEDAWLRLRSVFFDGNENPLDLLTALSVDDGDLPVATLVAVQGAEDWAGFEVAVRQDQETQPGRVATSRLRKAWRATTPDRAVVDAALAQADRAVSERCRTTGLERSQFGIKTAARRDWGES